MARGLDQHKERQRILSSFGKDLARRSKSSCELCEAREVKLEIYEVPPVLSEPEYESCIFICETCTEQIKNPKRMDTNHWRCLNNAVWSELQPVQVVALRTLRHLSQTESWASDLLEEAYFDEEVIDWADTD